MAAYRNDGNRAERSHRIGRHGSSVGLAVISQYLANENRSPQNLRWCVLRPIYHVFSLFTAPYHMA